MSVFPPTAPDSTGKAELTAYAVAYPGRITGLALRNEDWSVEIDVEWFSWAHGRILPESLRGKWLFFDTMHFEYRPEILLLSREGA